ncbi:MAG: hypothetical protein AAFO82_22095, partial [Bacteroidota bacterium]
MHTPLYLGNKFWIFISLMLGLMCFVSVELNAQIVVDEANVQDVQTENDGSIPISINATACAPSSGMEESCIVKLVPVGDVAEGCLLDEVPFTVEEGEEFNHTFNGLCPGTYRVVVVNNVYNCDFEGPEVTIDDCNESPEIVSVETTSSCSNQGTGTASITANGENKPLTYKWEDGLMTENSERSELAAGTYSISVVDDCGNEDTYSFTIQSRGTLEIVSETIESDVCPGIIDVQA